MKDFVQTPAVPDQLVYVSTRDLIIAIKKHKWIYLIMIFLVAAVTFIFLRTRVLSYTSTASFYLNDNPSAALSGGAETRPLDLMMTGENFNRVYQLTYSTKLYDHLIRKYHLYKHFGLDSTKEFSYERAVSILRTRITVKKSQYNLVSVSFKDPMRYLAADIANEIVAYVDQLNKNIIIESLRIKLNVFKTLIDDIRAQSAANTTNIDSLIRALNATIPKMEGKSGAPANLIELQQRLAMIITNMENSTSELVRLQRYYSLAMQTINLQSLPTLIVMQVALASPTSTSVPAAALSGLASLLALLMIFFLNYIYLRYGHYFKLLLSD